MHSISLHLALIGGYPDISALGGTKNRYCVVTDGGVRGVAGTSASCPVAAAVFARLNGVRLAAGKPVMGFLNPFIYQVCVHACSAVVDA